MSNGINKVILIGNLGKDPEIRYMPSGGAVASISLATMESWKDKQTGEQHGRTEWHRIAFYNRLAEIAGQYLKKGSKIYVEGKLQTRKWQDKNGQERYTTEIQGNQLQMLDGKNGQNERDNSDNYDSTTHSNSGSNSAPETPPEGFDDDIPF